MLTKTKNKKQTNKQKTSLNIKSPQLGKTNQCSGDTVVSRPSTQFGVNSPVCNQENGFYGRTAVQTDAGQ